MALQLHGVVVQYMVSVDLNPPLEIPLLSFTIDIEPDVEFGSGCFYVFETDGIVDFDFDDQWADFLVVPQDGILRDGLCSAGPLGIPSNLNFNITYPRPIHPFRMPGPVEYVVDIKTPAIPLVPPTVSFLVELEAPLVYRHIAGKLNALYGLEVTKVLTGIYDINTGAFSKLEAPYSLGVASVLQLAAGFTVANVVGKLETSYDIEEFAQVASKMAAPYAIEVLQTISAQYDLQSTVSAKLEALFDLEEFTQVATKMEGVYAIQVLQIISALYSLQDTVASKLEAKYNLSEFVAAKLASPYSLLSVTPVTTKLATPYTIMGPTIIDAITEDSAYILVDGYRVVVQSVDIGMPVGAFAWTMRADIGDRAAYAKLPLDKEFTLHYLGVDFSFMVDSRQIRRGALDSGVIDELSIAGITPTIKLQSPRSEPYNKIWDAGERAKAIVEEVLSDAGFTKALDWRILDWSIPAFRVSVSKGDYISPIKTIAEAVGATVGTNPDGDLIISYDYDTWPHGWTEADIEYSINESEHIASVNEVHDGIEFYNCVRVVDVAPSFSDKLAWESDERSDNSVMSGRILAFSAPYRDKMVLTTTGGAIIGARTVEYRSYEEDVVFVQGSGTVGNPIYSITSVVWYEEVLGSLEYDQYSSSINTSLDNNIGYSVARITYTSKVDVYKIEYNKYIPSGVYIPSQFLLEDRS